MTDAKKEQIKLRASYLNGIALLFMGLGGLAPAFAVYQNLLKQDFQWGQILAAIICLYVGGMSSWEMHRMAQKQLSQLDSLPQSDTT